MTRLRCASKEDRPRPTESGRGRCSLYRRPLFSAPRPNRRIFSIRSRNGPAYPNRSPRFSRDRNLLAGPNCATRRSHRLGGMEMAQGAARRSRSPAPWTHLSTKRLQLQRNLRRHSCVSRGLFCPSGARGTSENGTGKECRTRTAWTPKPRQRLFSSTNRRARACGSYFGAAMKSAIAAGKTEIGAVSDEQRHEVMELIETLRV